MRLGGGVLGFEIQAFFIPHMSGKVLSVLEHPVLQYNPRVHSIGYKGIFNT